MGVVYYLGRSKTVEQIVLELLHLALVGRDVFHQLYSLLLQLLYGLRIKPIVYSRESPV